MSPAGFLSVVETLWEESVRVMMDFKYYDWES
jgi:hypothetical protein